MGQILRKFSGNPEDPPETRTGPLKAVSGAPVERGADVQDVAKGIGLDGRIGSKFLHPGPGYGGSCFPKDTLALVRTAQVSGSPIRIVETVVAVNDERKKKMADKIAAAAGGSLRGKTVGVLGITFKPNTIIYGVPADSDMGKKVAAAKFGVCFHTTYTGSSLATLRAEAGANIKALKPTSKVVLVSSRYQDLSGTLTFTSAEHDTLRTLIGEIDTRTRKMGTNAFLQALAASPLLQSEFMIFQNSLVRGGESITLSPKVFVARLNAHLTTRADAEGATKKTDAGKAGSRTKYEQIQRLVADTEDALVDVLAWQHAVISAKTFIIQKLNAPGTLSTFYSSDKGVVAGSHEGFVAVDHQGNFVKLVDRSEFSRLNLTQGRFR